MDDLKYIAVGFLALCALLFLIPLDVFGSTEVSGSGVIDLSDKSVVVPIVNEIGGPVYFSEELTGSVSLMSSSMLHLFVMVAFAGCGFAIIFGILGSVSSILRL